MKPGRSVLIAGGYMIERLVTKGCIPDAAGEALERASALGCVGAVWTPFLGPQPARPNPASAMPPVLKKFRLSMLILLGRIPLRACKRSTRNKTRVVREMLLAW